MKKVLLVMFSVLLMIACVGSLPGKFTRLADTVEAKGKKMSEAQWEKSNAQFEKLVQEYVDNYDSLNSSQKREINKAISRYCTTALKSGVSGVAEVVNGILEELPGTLNELIKGAKDILEGLGL